MTDTQSDHILLAVRAAVEAGEAVLRVYGGEFAVEYKEDASPLTMADQRSHAVIKERLADTSLPLLSEEGAQVPYEERSTWKRFWLVDPLDGTKEFVKRNGEFTVNIACIQDGRPEFGVVVVPVRELIYLGVPGQGAYRWRSGREVFDKDLPALLAGAEKLPLVGGKERPFTVVGSRSHPSPDLEGFLDEQRERHPDLTMTPAGSSLKFCLVAEGRADLYPRFGPTMEWDTAAGQAVAEGAGKTVTEHETGLPMTYNKPDLHNPWFVVK